MSIYEETSKIRLKEQATEAINWIEEELEKIKGDSFFEAHKVDNLAKVREVIRKLV
jgi:hypothetical protein